jgi:hypothetical protein
MYQELQGVLTSAHFNVDDAGNDVVASTLGSRNVGVV